MAASFDLAVVIHMLHEVPDQGVFLGQLAKALKPGGKLLIKEPPGHVSAKALAVSLDLAQRVGFEKTQDWGKRGLVLDKKAG